MMNMVCDFEIDGNNINFLLELLFLDFRNKLDMNFVCM